MLNEESQNKLSTARLTLPLFVFITGLSITLLIVNAFYQSEVKFRQENLKSMAREFAKIQNLQLNNSILRIQSYNEISALVRGDSMFQRRMVREIISTTLFQRASVFTLKKKPLPNELPELLFVQRVKTDDDQLPVNNFKELQNPALRKKVQLMLEQDLPNSLAVTHSAQGDTLTLIWRSTSNPKDFIFFSSTLSRFFLDSPQDPELTAVIYDADTELALAIEQQGTSLFKFVEESGDPGLQNKKRFLLYSNYLISDSYGISIHWFQNSGSEISLYVLLVGLFGLALSLLTALFLSFILDQNRRIYTLVVNRTEQLETAMNQAQEANLAKTRFLANMSHELRTPLNLILGMIELQQLNAVDKKSQEYLKNMQTAGEHLLNLITDLLSMSKEDASDLKVNKSPINVPVFFEEIAAIVGPECRKKSLAFTLTIAPDIPATMSGDPVKIRQILLNLLRNSLKYTFKGFLSLEVTLNKKENADAGVCYLRFVVSDSGVGIPKNKMNQIFERFFQLESSKMLTEGGVGLGLSIVKDLVSKMDGNITVWSEVGVGSSFTVDLDLECRDNQAWIEKFQTNESTARKLAIIASPEKANLIKALLPPAVFSVTEFSPEAVSGSLEPFGGLDAILIAGKVEGLINRLQVKFPSKKVIVIGDESFIHSVDSLKNIFILSDTPLLPGPLYELLDFRSVRKKPLSSPAPTAEPAPAAPNRLIKALVVDDDAGNRQLMQAYLDNPNFAVTFANDGQEGMEKFKQTSPDIVIADLRMPRMNGFELSEAITAFEKQSGKPSTPFILLTADALESTSAEARKHAISLFLTKPVRRAKILHAISELTSQLKTL